MEEQGITVSTMHSIVFNVIERPGDPAEEFLTIRLMQFQEFSNERIEQLKIGDSSFMYGHNIGIEGSYFIESKDDHQLSLIHAMTPHFLLTKTSAKEDIKLKEHTKQFWHEINKALLHTRIRMRESGWKVMDNGLTSRLYSASVFTDHLFCSVGTLTTSENLLWGL